jgi:MoxR-like ATPase
MPLMLIGPTGCGKTTFLEEMAAKVGRPLITVTCHDDLTTTDLAGRFLVKGGDVEWQDGPLTSALRSGAICYLDEVVEARRDTLALLHSVADHRRSLYLERRRETVPAEPGFMLAASYNPRGRGSFKEMRPSLRQRFVTIAMSYLPQPEEADLVTQLSGVDRSTAQRLVLLATALRANEVDSLLEPPSTSTLVQAATLVARGVPERRAVEVAMLTPLSVDGVIDSSLWDLLDVTLYPAGAANSAGR